jgi:hypothetical protein
MNKRTFYKGYRCAGLSGNIAKKGQHRPSELVILHGEYSRHIQQMGAWYTTTAPFNT